MVRKPHTIPKSTFLIFTPSDEIDLSSDDIGRSGRTIKYEDFTWTNRIPKPLRFICLDSIANNFTKYPEHLFEWITPMNIEYLVETLNIDLPIPLVIHVPDGEYWRRIATSTMPKFISRPKDTEIHTLKSIYLTKHVSEIISNVVPDIMDKPKLTELLISCSPYVTALDCKHLRIPESLSRKWMLEEFNGNSGDPVHVDMGYVLTYLKNIKSVNLVYGPAEITFGAPDLYKFNISDMDALGYGLTISEHLTSLAITNSDLTLIKFNRLSPYLTKCLCLEELNLSFCNLESSGGTSVAHYVKTAKHLRLLNLRGNNIGPDTVEILAIVALWRRNKDYPAMELNLSKYIRVYYIYYYLILYTYIRSHVDTNSMYLPRRNAHNIKNSILKYIFSKSPNKTAIANK